MSGCTSMYGCAVMNGVKQGNGRELWELRLTEKKNGQVL